MNSSEKRYRVQIQFDVYADSDKEAIKKVRGGMDCLLDAHNEIIIYVGENSFGSLENNKIDHEKIESELFDEKWVQVREIMQNLPF